MNTESRIASSIKNISFGITAQVIQMLLGFVSRTVFIKYLAIEYLGVNGLFTNILSLFSLAELGIGSAFLYALYKPIAAKDEKKLAALIGLYSRIYMIIAGIVTVIGLLIMPFLDIIVHDPSPKIADDLYIIYGLFLFNTVSTYFFYYKLSLFHADQKSYVVSKNNTVIFILQNITQIVLLMVFQNFILYLVVQAFFQLSGNLVLSILVKKYYPFLERYKHEKVDEETKRGIYSNVKSTALIKIGGLLVNSTDNLILNYFSGLVMVGLLSNYTLLIGLASGLIIQVFAGLTGSIANVNVTESIEKRVTTFHTVNFANFWIYGWATVGMIVLINDFILIWVGVKYQLPVAIVIALAFNFYMYGMQNAVWTFKSTLGFFKQGQYLVLLTAIINLILSFTFGFYYGLLGILIATAIARLVTNAWYDPYIVFTLGLKKKPYEYFKKYLVYLLVLLLSVGVLLAISSVLPFSLGINFAIKIMLCLSVPNLFIFLFFRKTEEFRYLVAIATNIFLKLKSKIIR